MNLFKLQLSRSIGTYVINPHSKVGRLQQGRNRIHKTLIVISQSI